MIPKHSFCTVRLLLQQTLSKQFNPYHLTIVNESHLHSVPKGSETHFKITLVSDNFINQTHIQRHRAIYTAINELKNNYKIHAIQITAKSNKEWSESQEENPSPSCRGGSKIK